MTREHLEHLWAIVLAGGEGTRLASLTEALHGSPVPKQFAVIHGDESLLQATLRRIAGVVPEHRTVVVIGRPHLRWARVQLAERPALTTLVQPASLGTATAIELALAWIRSVDADPHVLVFPSDHYVGDSRAFATAVRSLAWTSRELGRLVLAGVVPELADADYGWIVAGRPVDPACPALEIEQFVEKPSPPDAARLHARGALWNTFILGGHGSLFAELARRHLPEHAAAFERLDRFSFAPGAPDLDELYACLHPADFSRDVLQHARALAVAPMRGTGWSDWGTPARVFASVLGTATERSLRRRLDAGSPAGP